MNQTMVNQSYDLELAFLWTNFVGARQIGEPYALFSLTYFCSREMFGEVHAKLWWESNRERIQAQYL